MTVSGQYPVEIRPVNDVPSVLDEVLGVYARAFAAPPYARAEDAVNQFAEILIERHIHRDDFRMVGAFSADQLVGLAYGYHGGPGQYWHDLVRLALGERLAGEWLDDAFELAEFAVLPAYQARGIGSRLHNALLSGIPYRTAIATTIRDNNPALDFYLRRGWVILRDDFRFPGAVHEQAIIGRALRAD